MSDIRTLIIPSAEPGALPVYDLSVRAPGLLEDDGLETAVILSLFTDRRAEADDTIPDGTGDRRGWWADAYPCVANDRVGSRLWLLSREKQLPSVVQRAREYADEALRWLVDDGIARRVTIEAAIVRTGVLGLGVTIERATQPVTQYKFQLFWQGA